MAIAQKDHIEGILAFIKRHPSLSSKEIHDGLGTEVGYATIKRALQKLESENLIITLGER